MKRNYKLETFNEVCDKKVTFWNDYNNMVDKMKKLYQEGCTCIASRWDEQLKKYVLSRIISD